MAEIIFEDGFLKVGEDSYKLANISKVAVTKRRSNFALIMFVLAIFILIIGFIPGTGPYITFLALGVILIIISYYKIKNVKDYELRINLAGTKKTQAIASSVSAEKLNKLKEQIIKNSN